MVYLGPKEVSLPSLELQPLCLLCKVWSTIITPLC